MTLLPLVVYRTTDPEILEAWKGAWVQRKELGDRLRRFAAQVDPDHQRDPITSQSPWGDEPVVGLAHQQDWPVPRGWKVSHRKGPLAIEPDRRTATGRQVEQHLARMKPGNLLALVAEYGVPEPTLNLDANVITRPSNIRLLDDEAALYVTWTTAPKEPPDGRWEQVRLSAYFAAVEAKDDADAAAKVAS